jgi:ABC-type phosphate transport system permease subunit
VAWQQDAFVVEIIRPQTPEITVVDVLVNALGLSVVLALVTLPLGAIAGWFLIRRMRRRRPEDDHMPSIQHPPSAE